MKNRHQIYIIFLGILFLQFGCTAATTNYRVQGFTLVSKSFDTISESPDIYEIIEIEKVKIYIVGDRKHFKWDRAAAYNSPINGYSTGKNEIYVLGKRLGDKIVVNQVILGHELHHLLNFKNSKIADPDQLDRLEWCTDHNLFGMAC
jgi:hypothetical protein